MRVDKYIAHHATLIMHVSVMADHLLHVGLAKAVDLMCVVLGGI